MYNLIIHKNQSFKDLSLDKILKLKKLMEIFVLSKRGILITIFLGII